MSDASNFRAPPQPERERAAATEQLIAEGATDTARWAQMNSLATQWDARAARAAEHIGENAHVLDIGCGAMALKSALKPGCTYQGADVVERAPGCLVVDLNQKQFPPGAYDWITFLGVLEYIHEPSWPLIKAHEAVPRLLLTYCCDITNGAAIPQRRGMGWVNDLSLPDLRALLARSGWEINSESVDKRGPHNHQMMLVCTRI